MWIGTVLAFGACVQSKKPGPIEVKPQGSQITPAPRASVSTGGDSLAHWLTTNPTPLCGFADDLAVQRQIAEKKYDFSWLENEPEFRANLANTELPLVGTAIDHAKKQVVVVLEPEFREWQSLGAKLQLPAPGFNVSVRSACHTKAAREAAEARLKARDWHPRAGSTAVSWSPDASFAGFVVTVDSAAPEVAKSLAQTLGPLVRVKPGKPGRLGAKTPNKR